MKYAPQHAMQAGGEVRKWSNLERTYSYSLLKLQFDCAADPYPGVLIVTDRAYKTATSIDVKNLQKELAGILEPLGEDTIAYWRMVADESERRAVLGGLTASPVFDDILG